MSLDLTHFFALCSQVLHLAGFGRLPITSSATVRHRQEIAGASAVVKRVKKHTEEMAALSSALRQKDVQSAKMAADAAGHALPAVPGFGQGAVRLLFKDDGTMRSGNKCKVPFALLLLSDFSFPQSLTRRQRTDHRHQQELFSIGVLPLF